MNLLGVSIDGIIPLLYYLSSPLLLVVSLFALAQIAVAKRDLRTRSTRESISVACSLIEKYATEIIALQNRIFLKAKPELYYRTKEFIDFDTDASIKTPGSFSKARWTLPPELLSLPVDLVNRLESFAAPFIARIADERVAYDSVGFAYCYSVSGMAYEVLAMRRHNPYLYRNLVTLYKLWKTRIEKSVTKERMEEMIDKFQKLEDGTISPIGTQ